MYRDLLNFEQLLLLHLVVYQPETYNDTSKWGYLHHVKVLSEKLSIKIFDDVIANHELCYFELRCNSVGPM